VRRPVDPNASLPFPLDGPFSLTDSKTGGAPRTPQSLQIVGHADHVTLENYDDQDYGYLRIVVTSSQLRIEYHPASDGAGAKTPDDFVTVDLAARKLVHFSGKARALAALEFKRGTSDRRLAWRPKEGR
jgi:hypothetical protein